MKSIQAVVVAAALATPFGAFAQHSNAPVTRAEVRAELVQLERAGYDPAKQDNASYPADIQAAEGRIATRNATTEGMGGVTDGAVQSGQGAKAITRSSPLFAHH